MGPPPVHFAAKFAYEAGRLPRVTSFAVHKYALSSVDEETIVDTCPEAAKVWRSCTMPSVSDFKFSDSDKRQKSFLFSDGPLNVQTFESDYCNGKAC